MRYVLNGRFFGQPVTGVQRYARNLAAHGLGVDGEVAVAVPGHGLVDLDVARQLVAGTPPGMGHVWEQVRLPRLLEDGDLLVNLGNYGPRRVRNQVLTLHDAASAIVPETFSRRHHALFSTFGVAAARRARHVVTHSERSKMDIVDRYELKPDGVHVVPCGVDERFSPGPPRGADRPYCLLVGAHDPRKNLPFLESIWPRIAGTTGLALVATARSASAAHATSSYTSDVVWNPSDDQLIDLYRGATLVLQPSRYEGFGLPLLEGAACGTPFLSSDVGAAMELAADPDRQVLALDGDAWVSAIEAFMGLDAVSHSAVVQQTIDVAGRFTWAHSARRLGEVLSLAAEEMRCEA